MIIKKDFERLRLGLSIKAKNGIDFILGLPILEHCTVNLTGNCLSDFWPIGMEQFCSPDCKSENHMLKVSGYGYQQRGSQPL